MTQNVKNYTVEADLQMIQILDLPYRYLKMTILNMVEKTEQKLSKMSKEMENFSKELKSIINVYFRTEKENVWNSNSLLRTKSRLDIREDLINELGDRSTEKI